MLNLQAKATEATEEPDGRRVSDLVLDGRRWRCGAGTSGHRGPFRRETGLLVPLGAVRRVPPGLFSLRNAGRWAAYLGNVGQEADLPFSELDYRAALRTLSVSLRVDALPEDLCDRFRTALHRRMRGALSLNTWLTAMRAIREWHEAQGPSRAELEARWRKASRGWGSAGPQGW